MKNIQMEFPEVGNAITKIKILKDWFCSSLDKAEDLISEILKIGCEKIFRMGNKWMKNMQEIRGKRNMMRMFNTHNCSSKRRWEGMGQKQYLMK